MYHLPTTSQWAPHSRHSFVLFGTTILSPSLLSSMPKSPSGYHRNLIQMVFLTVLFRSPILDQPIRPKAISYFIEAIFFFKLNFTSDLHIAKFSNQFLSLLIIELLPALVQLMSLLFLECCLQEAPGP